MFHAGGSQNAPVIGGKTFICWIKEKCSELLKDIT